MPLKTKGLKLTALCPASMLQKLPSWPPVKVWLSNFKNTMNTFQQMKSILISLIITGTRHGVSLLYTNQCTGSHLRQVGCYIPKEGRKLAHSNQLWIARGGYKWAMYCTLSIPHSLPQSKQKEKAIHSHFSAEVCFWLVICPLQVYLVWFNNTVCMTTTAWQQVSPKDNL